jgi:DAK2 domain fusion protein YloV
MTGDGFTLGPADVKRVMSGYLGLLREQREALDRLNVYPVPDGDTGTNMVLTMESVVAETDSATSMAELSRAMAHGSLMGAQGNSGIILAEILREIAAVLDGQESIHSGHLAEGLERASEAAYGAVGSPQEGTILTVLRASAVAATDGDPGSPEPLARFLERVYRAAEASLRRTPEMLPVLREAGVVDAGGGGYLLLLAAFLDEVTGKRVALPAEIGRGVAARVGRDRRGDEPRYEVVFLLEGEEDAGHRLMESWDSLGNSIVVVGGDGTWTCHVHTDDVGGALEAGVEAGTPHRIQVTDLFAQAADEAFHRDTSFEPLDRAASAHVGVVAVAVGRGAIDLFRDAAVQGIVVGGHTMNPSVRELLEVVEAVPARIVVVLPNNRNVIPAAEQLDTLTKKRVLVVPTRSMPEGLAALIEYDTGVTDAVAVTRAMATAAERVTTVEVTSAVRDAVTPAGTVHLGDWLGLVGGSVSEIASPRPGAATRLRGFAVGSVRRARLAERRSAAALTKVVTRLLERTVGDDASLLTVITGSGARPETTDAARRWMRRHRPGVAVEVLDGGQPLYPYILGVE